MQRLEAEKEGLERDLSFKADQAQQYDGLLAAVRENNRQLQVGLLPSSGDVCDVKRKKKFSAVFKVTMSMLTVAVHSYPASLPRCP